jgi:hypothetical protein
MVSLLSSVPLCHGPLFAGLLPPADDLVVVEHLLYQFFIIDRTGVKGHFRSLPSQGEGVGELTDIGVRIGFEKVKDLHDAS